MSSPNVQAASRLAFTILAILLFTDVLLPPSRDKLDAQAASAFRILLEFLAR